MPEITETLAIIKQLVDNWLDIGSNPNRDDLKVLLNAIDSLKNFAEEKLRHDSTSDTEELQPNTRTLRSGTIRVEQSANQARVRAPQVRGPQIRAHNHVISRTPVESTSLFVPENDESVHDENSEEFSIELPNHFNTGGDRDLELGDEDGSGLHGSPSHMYNNTEQGTEQDLLLNRMQDDSSQRTANDEEQNVIPEMLDFSEDQPGFFDVAFEDLMQDHSPPGFEDDSTAVAETHPQMQDPDLSEQDDEANIDLLADEMSLHDTIGSMGPETQHERQVLSSYERAILQNYLELAGNFNFRLPHEPADDGGGINMKDCLLPLVEGTALSSRLIHGLLHTLLPGSHRILEVDPCDSDGERFLLEEPAEQFAVIVREPEPLLFIGDPAIRTLFIVGRSIQEFPILKRLQSYLTDWGEQRLNPQIIAPKLEHTLALVYIAETCLRHFTPITEVPSSYALRIRFLGSLLAPYQRNSILIECGMPENLPLSTEMVDAREDMVQLASPLGALEFSIPDVDGFDMRALEKAFHEKPVDMNRRRYLRILQCIVEIGSPQILESLICALSKPVMDEISQNMDQPIVEKLFHIHLLLDKQGGQDHLAVARSRYVKYCYFETYWLAVKSLQEEKRVSDRERHRVLLVKQTASYKQGLQQVLPPTPHTDRIQHVYKDLNDAEKKKRATDMVKDEIARRVSKIYNGNERRIRRNITKYIKEGKVLHYILQGSACLNPALVVIFPSCEPHPPLLDLSQWNIDLQEDEQRSLSRPIGIKDIEGLTQPEAKWFGKVLQCRPALLEEIPKALLQAISSDLVSSDDFLERDPEHFIHKPLRFFS